MRVQADGSTGQERAEAMKARAEAAEARCRVLEEALRDIIDPIGRIRRRAQESGRQIDGMWAVRLSESVGYLQEIAKDALAAEDPR